MFAEYMYHGFREWHDANSRKNEAEKQLNYIDLDVGKYKGGFTIVVWKLPLFIDYKPREYYEKNCYAIKSKKQDKQMKQVEK